jgi:antitoxin (DNA-binding transcriptional repressor) of toxin-antitoxin stability system
METVRATDLKNRLGSVLRRAAFAPVAVERHGHVVAFLVPATHGDRSHARSSRRARAAGEAWGRRDEERVARLCAGPDFRPSRWRRAGNPRDLAGVATMLASEHGFDRPRLLALAEALHPGMSSGDEFPRWLAEGRVDPARFLPMVRAEKR